MRNIKTITLFTMICLISSAAFGGLTIDMRNVTEQAGGSAVIDSVNHLIMVSSADVGKYFTFEVWATVSGGTSTNDLLNADMFIRETNILQGQVHGNMAGINGGAPDMTMYEPVFQGATIPLLTTNVVSGDQEFNNPLYCYEAFAVPLGSGVDATSGVELGIFTFNITSLVGTSTTPTVISLVPRTTSTAGANYFLDTTNYNGRATDANHNYLYQAAVNGSTWSFTAPVPEPCTLTLLGFGAISLLVYTFRPRKRSAWK